jgi:transposase
VTSSSSCPSCGETVDVLNVLDVGACSECGVEATTLLDMALRQSLP